MGRPWTPRRQGDAGELSAMEWLTLSGALVCKPLFESPDYDLIADWEGRLERVQVKTSTCWRLGRYEVALATRGGNQSWSGLVKRLDSSRCDALFVHTGDGRRWYIPASALDGSTGIRLGGPKYAGYEVDSGRPLQRRPPPIDRSEPEPPTLN
jgi:PD-(D/E)XK nuclease superfamily protein